MPSGTPRNLLSWQCLSSSTPWDRLSSSSKQFAVNSSLKSYSSREDATKRQCICVIRGSSTLQTWERHLDSDQVLSVFTSTPTHLSKEEQVQSVKFWVGKYKHLYQDVNVTCLMVSATALALPVSHESHERRGKSRCDSPYSKLILKTRGIQSAAELPLPLPPFLLLRHVI